MNVPDLEATLPDEVRRPPASSRSEKHLLTMHYVWGATALAGYATSIVTGSLALVAKSDASSKCVAERHFCPDATALDDASRARTLAWFSTSALGIGIASTVAALLWPMGRRPTERAAFTVVPVPAGAFLSVRTIF